MLMTRGTMRPIRFDCKIDRSIQLSTGFWRRIAQATLSKSLVGFTFPALKADAHSNWHRPFRAQEQRSEMGVLAAQRSRFNVELKCYRPSKLFILARRNIVPYAGETMQTAISGATKRQFLSLPDAHGPDRPVPAKWRPRGHAPLRRIFRTATRD